MTRIVAIGDVIGKAGRSCLKRWLPRIHSEVRPDAIIINGENAAGGFGLTRTLYDEFVNQLGIDCITMGNHWHDKPEIFDFAKQVDRLVLPANMMNVREPRDGLKLIQLQNGRTIAVMNLIGKAFMHSDNRNPFHEVQRLLPYIPDYVKIRVVDMHAEATSEKQGMGFYLAGKASLVYGTHSHVQTADERILEGWTGFVTDVGMTGSHDSIIGMKKSIALDRLTESNKTKRFEPAKAQPWLCFLAADIDDTTGKCDAIKRYQWREDGHNADSLDDED